METLHCLKSPKLARISEGDGREDGDTITNLPETIINYILSFLETIDVVRASVVCKSWRHLWISSPCFNFDVRTAGSNSSKFNGLATRIEKFEDFVNWVLILTQNSPSIERFRLRGLIVRDDDYSVFMWINGAPRRKVKELDIAIDSQTPVDHPLLLSLVKCESLVLLKLDLREGALKLPNSLGFRWLKSLELEEVKLTDESAIQKLIAACPLLEDLSLNGCIFSDFKVLEICSCSLKYLTIDNIGFRHPCCNGLNKSELKIACSSLVSLNYMEYALDVSFQDLVSLENAFIDIDLDVMGHRRGNK